MKVTLSLLVILFGLTVNAGPEDHIANQTCYVLGADQIAHASPQIPDEICLENLSINPADESISVYSYFNQSLFNNLKVTRLTRKNEDYYSFTATNMLYNQWNSGCGDGEQVELNISGQVFFTGEADVSGLVITVVQDTTNDTCHSQPQSTVYNYHVR